MATPKFLETAQEKQAACVELIKKFKDIGEVVPTVEAAVAAVKQAQQRREAASPPTKKSSDPKPTSPDAPETKLDHPSKKPPVMGDR